jgi:hypothetical protein
MSPTQFTVRMAATDRELNRARAAKDIASMQAALSTMTGLLRAYYGVAPRAA